MKLHAILYVIELVIPSMLVGFAIGKNWQKDEQLKRIWKWFYNPNK